MTEEMARKAVSYVFDSPSRIIKVEFQGGEPLLNFELVKQIVFEVISRNSDGSRDIQFVIATNLSKLTDEVLEFCRVHDVYISTSLDGPRQIHNGNRPRVGDNSYELTVEGIRRVRDALGPDRISALMTTTEASLKEPHAIIDEYLAQGFSSIFLRPVSPYGFAVKTGQSRRYDDEEWLQFYKTGLEYIFDLNRNGVGFREEYASLLLRKILTPYPTGYVDLQSPSGLANSCIAFNYDGGIYASDESRMLAEMGDFKFRLGNLECDTFQSVMNSPSLRNLLVETATEGVPMCSDCGIQPYCGSDPVFHHATQGDVVGCKPKSVFCRRSMALVRHLITLLEDHPSESAILKSWL